VRGNVATGEAIIEEEGWEEEQESETEEVAAGANDEEEVDEIPAPVQIHANRALQRKWRKLGVIQELTEEVWCAAWVHLLSTDSGAICEGQAHQKF
jgi:hypothetical protein